MTVTTADVAAYVSSTQEKDIPFISDSLAEAEALVSDYVGEAVVPAVVLDRSVLEVAADLYYRKSAPSGLKQFATEYGGSAVRIARDPLQGVYPLLSRYVGAPIG